MNTVEEWKPIKDYEELYEISSFGRVQNSKTGKVIKEIYNVEGYCRVELRKDQKRKNFMIHRLVAQHFIENHNNKPIVDHIDRVRNNNNVLNLRWVTSSENSLNMKNIDSVYKTSKYRGVYYHKNNRKWICKISNNNKPIHIGCFISEKNAARAYNEYVKTNGLDEFAILNEISDEDEDEKIIEHEVKKKTSKYRGISWYKKRNKWRALIMVNKKSHLIGYFDNEIDAAIVYNEYAYLHLGDKAKLNEIEEEEWWNEIVDTVTKC